jgi:hypothetical protein
MTVGIVINVVTIFADAVIRAGFVNAFMTVRARISGAFVDVDTVAECPQVTRTTVAFVTSFGVGTDFVVATWVNSKFTFINIDAGPVGWCSGNKAACTFAVVSAYSVDAISVDWTFIPPVASVVSVTSTFIDVDTVSVGTDCVKAILAHTNIRTDLVVADLLVDIAVVCLGHAFVDILTLSSVCVTVASVAGFAFAVKVSVVVNTLSMSVAIVFVVFAFVNIVAFLSVSVISVDASTTITAFGVATLCQFMTIMFKGGTFVCVDTCVRRIVTDKTNRTVASYFTVANTRKSTRTFIMTRFTQIFDTIRIGRTRTIPTRIVVVAIVSVAIEGWFVTVALVASNKIGTIGI